MNQFIRYVLVGLVNTSIGFGVILGCMYWVGLSPELSNVTGYIVGLLVSYFVHRSYTFQSTRQQRMEFVSFIFIFAISYIANLAVLICLVRVLGVHAGLGQAISSGVYVGISFFLNKFYVFRNEEVRVQ